MSFRFAFAVAAILILATGASAESRQSSEPELRVCTQNLNRAGDTSKKTKRKQDKVGELVARFIEARCDVIAVQEVVGSDAMSAQVVLRRLASRLSQRSGKRFEAFVGESRDNYIRNGFLLNAEAVTVEAALSHVNFRLPKLQPRASYHHFTRGPFELRLKIPGVRGSNPRRAAFISVHFKSKANSWKDPTATQFEAIRMEMAEAVRSLVLRTREELGPDSLVLVLGDFNTGDDAAAFSVLIGERRLDDFQLPGRCQVGRTLRAECSTAVPVRRLVLAPAFTYARSGPGVRTSSHSYRRQQALIDNVLLPAEQFWMLSSGLEVAAGVVGTFRKGSDHKLLWVELNW